MTIFIVGVFFPLAWVIFCIIVCAFSLLRVFFSIEGDMLIGVQIIIFQIDNLTTFLTSGENRA